MYSSAIPNGPRTQCVGEATESSSTTEGATMAPETTKLRITIGNFSVSYEGSDHRLEDGLAKLVKEISSVALDVKPMISNEPEIVESPSISDQSTSSTSADPLNVFLRKQNPTTDVQKFLLTAVWVGLKNNKKTITIKDVTSALRDHTQSKLSNPSECLRSNIKKGNCVKEGTGQFYVTETGRESLSQ